MEGFNYTDIFATKGIEYLIIIAFLLLLIPFWIFLNKKAATIKVPKAIYSLSTGILQIPLGLFYSKNHMWMFLEKSGSAKVGLDDLLLHITGEVKFSNLKKPGEIIRKGELLTKIEQDGKHLNIFSPVSGRITEINSAINDQSDILHEDPYDKGWICKVKPSRWIIEADACYFAEEAAHWLKTELERFKDFLSVSLKNSSTEPSMVIMQDGGVISDSVLSLFPDEIWKDFEKEFLNLN